MLRSRDTIDASLALLAEDELSRIYRAVLDAGLAENRGALISGLPGEIRDRLPIERDPASQILSDLRSLAADRDALAVWLRNAALLAESRIEGRILSEALASLETRALEPASRKQLIGGRARYRQAVIAAAGLTIVAASWFALRPARSPEEKSPSPGRRTVELAAPPEAAAVPLEIVQIALSDGSATSFRESQPRSGVRYFSIDANLSERARSRDCLEAGGFRASPAELRQTLARFAKMKGVEEVLGFFDSDESLRTLARDKPMYLSMLVPQPQEWTMISAADREIYLAWLKACVRVPYPVFQITLRNLSDRPRALTGIIYENMSDFDIPRASGEYGPLSPRAVYVHQLAWRQKYQRADLVPPFELAPSAAGSFEVQLAAGSGSGREWRLRMLFLTEDGIAARSEELALEMPFVPPPE